MRGDRTGATRRARLHGVPGQRYGIVAGYGGSRGLGGNWQIGRAANALEKQSEDWGDGVGEAWRRLNARPMGCSAPLTPATRGPEHEKKGWARA